MCYYHIHFRTNLNLVVNIFKQGTEESNYIFLAWNLLLLNLILICFVNRNTESD